MIIIIMRGENFVAHRCAAEHRLRITRVGDWVGPQSQSGHVAEEKNLCPAGNRTLVVQPLA
jgi:hypothetical protein